MYRLKVDLTDLYNDLLIFVVWYTAWNILDVVFGIRPYDQNTITFILIFILSMVVLVYRATNI